MIEVYKLVRFQDSDAASDEGEEDPVPAVRLDHFVEAMRHARRSVSDDDIRRYERFADSLQRGRGVIAGTFRLDSTGPFIGHVCRPLGLVGVGGAAHAPFQLFSHTFFG